jgi:hypothetical protein
MHQVLKASENSEAIMRDCMLFFPASINADKHKVPYMNYSLL